jgi:hypothetical protein
MFRRPPRDRQLPCPQLVAGAVRFSLGVRAKLYNNVEKINMPESKSNSSQDYSIFSCSKHPYRRGANRRNFITSHPRLLVLPPSVDDDRRAPGYEAA